MNDASFAEITRRAVAAVSRRAALSALGAAVGAAIIPSEAEAKKGCSKKCDGRCAAQVGFCSIAVADVCNGSSNPDLCNGRCSLCCSRLRNCDPNEVYDSATCLMQCVP